MDVSKYLLDRIQVTMNAYKTSPGEFYSGMIEAFKEVLLYTGGKKTLTYDQAMALFRQIFSRLSADMLTQSDVIHGDDKKHLCILLSDCFKFVADDLEKMMNENIGKD